MTEQEKVLTRELRIAERTIQELTAIIEKRDEEIALLETRLEDLGASHAIELEGKEEKAGDALRDALRAFADQLGDAGEIVNTPNGKYRWIEQQVKEVGL
jgi:predicted RNase H-like nuclease (RuvC/YqgF family)